MSKEGHFSIVTPSKLQTLYSKNFGRIRKRAMICIKDVVPSPKRSTKLNLCLKSTRTTKSSGRNRTVDNEKKLLPSFLFDFLDEERPQIVRPGRIPINLPGPEYFKARRKTMHERSVEVIHEEEEKFPELSVQRVWDRSLCKTSEKKQREEKTLFYKPYVIEITPRSSVTLYGIEPINQFYNKKRLPERKARTTKPINIRNITSDKSKNFDPTVHPVIISSPAKNFAEKLQRVQDIAKDAEASFA